MKGTEHVIAVVDDPTGADQVLEYARDSVQNGGTATVVLLATPSVRRGIKDLARQQGIPTGEAEQFYFDRVRETFKDAIGGNTETIVSGQLSEVRCVFDTATKTRATAVAVPTSLAGRRGWSRALSRAPIAVTVTPSRAA